MGKFDLYKVDLKSMQQDVREHEFLLDNLFFTNIGGEDIQKGKIKVLLTVSKKAGVFDLAFHLNGIVVIPCDRCLDDLDLSIDTTARLIVKLGKDYSEESDEIVVIPESEGVINLAWFLYEFTVLAIPIKHIHAPGKCNQQMTSKLKKHSTKSDDSDSMEDVDDIVITERDEDEEIADPRWDALRDFKED